MANENVNFDTCPVGKLNEQKIEHTAELFSKDLKMSIEKLENKMDSMNEKMDTRFDALDTKIDKLNGKFHSLDEKLKNVDNIETFVEEKIQESTKDKLFNFFKWVISALIGGAAVTIVGSIALKFLHLN